MAAAPLSRAPSAAPLTAEPLLSMGRGPMAATTAERRRCRPGGIGIGVREAGDMNDGRRRSAGWIPEPGGSGGYRRGRMSGPEGRCWRGASGAAAAIIPASRPAPASQSNSRGRPLPTGANPCRQKPGIGHARRIGNRRMARQRSRPSRGSPRSSACTGHHPAGNCCRSRALSSPSERMARVIR